MAASRPLPLDAPRPGAELPIHLFALIVTVSPKRGGNVTRIAGFVIVVAVAILGLLFMGAA